MKQKERLLNALKHRDMTTLEVIRQLGIVRPAAVVLILRQEGWNIETKMITVKNRWQENCQVASYHLKDISGPSFQLALDGKHYHKGLKTRRKVEKAPDKQVPTDGWADPSENLCGGPAGGSMGGPAIDWAKNKHSPSDFDDLDSLADSTTREENRHMGADEHGLPERHPDQLDLLK